MTKAENFSEGEKGETKPKPAGATGTQGGGWSYGNIIDTLDHLEEIAEEQREEVTETIINDGKISGRIPR